MSFDVKETLLSLLVVDAIPGHEQQMARRMLNAFKKTSGDVSSDFLGNVIARYPASQPSAKTIAVFAHMDEVGLMVRKIDDNGFLRFERVGGPAYLTMPGTQVNLHCGNHQTVHGCIGVKSYHFAGKDERKQAPDLKDMWIDIGARSKEDALALGVKVGTPVSIYNPPRELANGLVCSKAIDDRVGCTALLGIAAAIQDADLPYNVVLIASVQEEFNIRGILPAINKVKPDLAIGIDVTPACDTPDLSHYSDVAINGGPAVTCLNYHGGGTLAGLITHPAIIEWIEKAAEEKNINVQREVAPGVITETGYIQIENDGAPCASLAIPCRYTHSASEVASIHDVSDCITIVTQLVTQNQSELPVTGV